MKQRIPIPEKLLLTVEEAAEYSHIGQAKIRELLNDSECDFVIRKGTYSLIKRKKFEEYLLERNVL